MQFLSDVYLRCPDCNGKRFRDEVLEVTLEGKSISDVLELTIAEAIADGALGPVGATLRRSSHRLHASTSRQRATALQATVQAHLPGLRPLPSVVGGLVNKPLIAVPTSTGYGTGIRGFAAMLAMLNTCVPGVTVVNIDNGFGAGIAAAMINRRG